MKKINSIFLAIPIFIKHFRTLLKQLLFFSELKMGEDFVLAKLKGKPFQELEIFDISPSFEEIFTPTSMELRPTQFMLERS